MSNRRVVDLKKNNVLAKDKYETQKKEVYIAEAYLTALFWNNPEQYDFYPEETMNSQVFLNPIWSFYFGLGREMNKKQITIFDDISAVKVVNEIGILKDFEKYGEFETINEVMQEVEGREDNLEAYYSELKKYRMLVDLCELFGMKVLEATGKAVLKLIHGSIKINSLFRFPNRSLDHIICYCHHTVRNAFFILFNFFTLSQRSISQWL